MFVSGGFDYKVRNSHVLKYKCQSLHCIMSKRENQCLPYLGFKKKISTFFRLSQHKECAMHRVLSKCQYKLAGKPGKKKAKAVVDIFGVGN